MKFLFILLLFLSSCHPFFMLSPKPLSKNVAQSNSEHENNIQVAVDEYGIPYIYAHTPLKALYALGHMHAKDRMFQMDLIRHLALGKLSELFGEKMLSMDKKYRILSFELEKQKENLAQEELKLISSYILGINNYAKNNSLSSEYFLLGKKFAPFEITDVIAIARLQSWQLANDLYSEIARHNISLQDLHPDLKKALLAPIASSKAQIFPGKNITGKKNPQENKTYAFKELIHFSDNEHDLAGSNAWAVGGEITQEGQALLMNDPHLRHDFPSQFYLATLIGPDFYLAGATFVGIPAILIGSSHHLSWGITAALTNTQDTVLLKLDEKNANSYVVDNKSYQFKSWPQKFCISGKETCEEKNYQVSMFGIILDEGYVAKQNRQNEALALRWSGFLTNEHKNFATDFLKIAHAKNVFEATDVIKNITLPSVNMLLADTSGNIAYAYAGSILDRSKDENPFLPLDGTKLSNVKIMLVPKEKKPIVINPKRNFLVTANQNLFAELLENKSNFFGLLGAESFRAKRIKQNIKKLKSEHKLNQNELTKLQMDSVSLEALTLAPLLGQVCSEHFSNQALPQRKFAALIKNFDGNFSENSLAALPYDLLIKNILYERLAKVFKNTSSINNSFHVRFFIKDNLLKELKGEKTLLFADKATNFKNYLGSMCETSFQEISQKAGKRASAYKWGKHHYLRRSSPLAMAPYIGTFFKDKKRPISGYPTAPMAESGLPVTYGAVLRMSSKMSLPPQMTMVLDSGNSGHFGNQNSLDQVKNWQENIQILFHATWNDAKKHAKSFLRVELKE